MQIGPYDIIQEVYRTKPVTIYMARDIETDEIVALKLLTLDLYQQRSYRELFMLETEIMATATIQEAPVVPMLGAGFYEEQPYLVLKWMTGGTLAERITPGGMSIEEIAPIIERIARALDVIHEVNVIHRDVKPDNILFDENGQAFLADFGGVKTLTKSGQSNSDDVLGTMQYMPPEAIEAEYSLSTDIYSFGITIYEMFTGEHPYNEVTLLGAMTAHINRPMPDITILRPDIPGAVNDVIRKATSKTPSQRYNSAAKLIKDLHQAMKVTESKSRERGRAITERPTPPPPEPTAEEKPPGTATRGAVVTSRSAPMPAARPEPAPAAIEPITEEKAVQAAEEAKRRDTKRLEAIERVHQAEEADDDGLSVLGDIGEKEEAETSVADTGEVLLELQGGAGQSATDDIPEHPVLFSAYYSSQIEAESDYKLLVYIHVPQAILDIRTDAETARDKLGGVVPTPTVSDQVAQLAEGTIVSVTPESKQIEFEPVSVAKRFRTPWVRFDFGFSAPKKLEGQTVEGRISISVSAIEIAHINFKTAVKETQLLVNLNTHPKINPLFQAKLQSKTSKAYQRIFISYSRDDTVIAEAYRQVQIAMGNDAFMDTHSLRTGENWQAALARAIDEADILQLFWSPSAAASDSVKHEWDYALNHKCNETRCVDFIRPVYWEAPLHPPPSELGHLNFRYVSLKPVTPDDA